MSRHWQDHKRWYENKPVQRDLDTVKEYADWLARVIWQVYGTFTFTWPVSDPQADTVFMAFINFLEHELGAPIAFVRGDEKRWSGCGKPGSPRHYHVLMTSTAYLDPQRLKAVWRKFAGSGCRKFDGSEYVQDSAKVLDRFDPRARAEYCLKFINETDGDWTHRNLHYFVSGVTPVGHRAKRRAARHAKRVSGTAVRAAVVPVRVAPRFLPALFSGRPLPVVLRPRPKNAPPTTSTQMSASD